ncbi:hypothetical protein RJ639_030212 [Escallonia herrerae]|uniref:DUF4219 domain-containing protein n=1 Tax=Escallonia herrerae TaxID=1293975 RepID=A0AA89BDC5_9ASTE|nr:hypothetical protein RJ639_030212 [Escallonia herrerae]
MELDYYRSNSRRDDDSRINKAWRSRTTFVIVANRSGTVTNFQAISAIKKLNDHNYSSWQTLMQSYLEGQELWELISGNEMAPPALTGTNEAALWK